MSLQVPEDSLKEYLGTFDDKPYLGNKGYLPHQHPRAAYAAMITRFDKHIGQIMTLLKELKIDDNTIVMFSSDNGPTFNGGSDSAYFNSAGPFDGLKCSLKEGGIRVPMIVKWPGKIKAAAVSDHVSSFDDVFPTICEIIGAETPKDITGTSFAHELLGKEGQKKKNVLYWEYGSQQAIRNGDWKLYRRYNKKADKVTAFLYNLKEDIGEKNDLSQTFPEKVQELLKLIKQNRSTSKYFPSPWDKY